MVAEVARRRDCLAGYDEGMLKTYLDGELPEAWRDQVAGHVPSCPTCTDRLARLRLDGSLVQGRFKLLEPPAAEAGSAEEAGVLPRPPVAAVLARARRPEPWTERAGTWWRGLTPPGVGGPWRIAGGIAAGLVLGLGVAATQPAVQSFAQAALQQFRVQRVQPVQVDLAALRGAQSPANERTLDAFFRSGTYQGPEGPRVRTATTADAKSATGLTLRGLGKLPNKVKGGPTLLVSEPISFTFTYDSSKLTEVAKEAGVTDQALLGQLQKLNGVTVRGDVPAAAAVVYGAPFPEGTPPAGAARSAARSAVEGNPGNPKADRPAGAPSAPAIALVQLKPPSVQVPKDVDVQALRQQLLDVGVKSGAIPPSLATQLLAISDFNTLPVPVVEGQASQVDVDGVKGTLITHDQQGGAVGLTWVKDGVLYGVVGHGVTAPELLEAARSITALQ
jgi:hypothetical protein